MVRFAAKSVTIPLFRVGAPEQNHYGETVVKFMRAVQSSSKGK